MAKPPFSQLLTNAPTDAIAYLALFFPVTWPSRLFACLSCSTTLTSQPVAMATDIGRWSKLRLMSFRVNVTAATAGASAHDATATVPLSYFTIASIFSMNDPCWLWPRRNSARHTNKEVVIYHLR